ncbi:low temperature requirement protein A [Sphingorhabdus sp.]|uniref:low temperature requirement protein A n=1 Tax=Sphingorhabdus sp. TaxID=1902408 RepID=UPI0035AF120A|nr:low temperature requirement protein A [Sphingomonadaceae bacterium]
MSKPRPHLFRTRDSHDHSPVTYIELFFDLVFVFAITQLSHRLLAHLSPLGALETLILLLAVWWVWIYTSWVTNWLDPERAHVRLMLIILMTSGLVLSAAIPEAFEANGLLFALSYIFMQLFRTLYMVWASVGVNESRRRNFVRIAFWFLLSMPFWVAGALSDTPIRLLLWIAALAIEYAGPYALFRTPGYGRSLPSDWDISGAHMAERCALFMIIALGEAVLITGATFAQLERDTPTWVAFISSFIGSATMWWIYFDIGAKRGSKVIAESENVGLIARTAYTYLHIPIVAGVVVTAVADEKILAHPVGHSDLPLILVAIGGPVLFLFGNQMFKWVTSGARIPPFSHFLGLFALAAVGVGGWLGHWEPLTLGVSANAVLVFTAVWEWFSLHGGWQRWAPWMAPLFNRFGRAS